MKEHATLTPICTHTQKRTKIIGWRSYGWWNWIGLCKRRNTMMFNVQRKCYRYRILCAHHTHHIFKRSALGSYTAAQLKNVFSVLGNGRYFFPISNAIYVLLCSSFVFALPIKCTFSCSSHYVYNSGDKVRSFRSFRLYELFDNRNPFHKQPQPMHVCIHNFSFYLRP